jgi:hypothetical protein
VDGTAAVKVRSPTNADACARVSSEQASALDEPPPAEDGLAAVVALVVATGSAAAATLGGVDAGVPRLADVAAATVGVAAASVADEDFFPLVQAVNAITMDAAPAIRSAV